tara:strand:+ start:245 stop:850 length:606 start_codon:yes stop_codon:yes gene_type:complete
MAKRFLLFPVVCMLFGFGSLEKREKEAISGSGTLSVPKAFWPAFGLEYEHKVVPKVSVAAFVSAGRFDPLLFRVFLRGTPAYQLTFDHWSVGGRASWYAIGDFHHGMFVGVTSRFTRPSYTTTLDNKGSYNGYLNSLLGGAHVGYKIILSPGITAQVHAGVAYNYLSEATLTQNDLVETDDFPTTLPPVATFGDLSLGWSF